MHIAVNFSQTNDPIDIKKSLHSNFDMLYNILEAQPSRSMGSVLNPSLVWNDDADDAAGRTTWGETLVPGKVNFCREQNRKDGEEEGGRGDKQGCCFRASL